MVGLGRRAAAHDAWLSPDELTVLLVAQANGFRRNATAPGGSVIRGNCRHDCDCIFNRNDKWFPNRRFARVKVYFKSNLFDGNARILEMPFYAPIEPNPAAAPAILHYLKGAAR